MRNRVAIVAVASSAALLVAVLMAVWWDDDPPLPPAAPLPSTAVATPYVTRLVDLPIGAGPSIDYVEDGTYVGGSGSIDLRDAVVGEEIVDATPFHGWSLVSTRAGHGSAGTVRWVDGAGRARWSRCGSERLALSADGEFAAMVTLDRGACRTWGAPRITRGPTGDGQDVSQVVAGGLRIDLVAVTADEVVYNASTLRRGWPRGVFVTDLMSEPRRVPGLETATALDADGGHLAGISVDGRGVVVEAATGELVVGLGSWIPDGFSPDGRYVSAGQRRFSTPPVGILDTSDGRLVLQSFGGAGGAPNPGERAWEDDTHLLVAVNDYDHHAIVRIGVDGNLEAASRVIPAEGPGQLFPGF